MDVQSYAGAGSKGGYWHSHGEWCRPVDAYFGPKDARLTVLVLADWMA